VLGKEITDATVRVFVTASGNSGDIIEWFDSQNRLPFYELDLFIVPLSVRLLHFMCKVGS
jgi:hypothetical protein